MPAWHLFKQLNRTAQRKQDEFFYYILDGDPKPENGFIDLDDNKPGLGLTISKKFDKDFNIIN
jgi:hypothetical protein